MKKFLLALVAVVISCLTVSAQELLYDLKLTGSSFSKGVSAYNATFTSTVDGNVWTLVNFNNNNSTWDYVKCGHKTAAYVSTITSDFKMPENVSKVTVVINAVAAAASLDFQYASLSTSPDNTTWTEVDKVTTIAKGNLDFNVPAPEADLYYRVSFSCGAKSNGQITISEVKYYGTAASGETKQPAELSFTDTAFEVTLGDTFTAPTLVNPNNLSVVYSSSDEDVASVDPATGVVTLKAKGSVTITASFAGNDDFKAGKAEYTVTVLEAAADNELYTLLFGSSANVDLKYYPKNSGYTDTFTYTLSEGVTFSISNFNNNNNGWANMIKCGRKGNASVGYVATDFPVAKLVTSVDVTTVAATIANVQAINLESSADGENWTVVASGDTSLLKASGEATITITNPSPVPNQYYRVAFDCTSGSANGLLSLSAVKFFGEEPSGDVKQSADIAFAEKTVSTAIGMDFTAPALTNPNNLTVTYATSNAEVADVDAATGVVTIKGAGSAIITASFDGNDNFYAAKASYTITVAKGASTAKELVAASQAANDVVYIAGNFTVAYVNDAYVYVVDEYNEPALFYNFDSGYKMGDVLTPGYYVTYSPYNNLPEWKINGTLPEVEAALEVYYPVFDKISNEEINRVGYLYNVTFAADIATDKGKTFTGTLEDGTQVTFRTQWALEEGAEAGTYNVLCAVGIFNTTLQAYPIAFYTPVAPVDFPTEIKVTSNATESFSYKYVPEEENEEWPLNELNATATTSGVDAAFTIEIPEGYTGMLHSPIFVDNDINPMSLRAEAPDWVDVALLAQSGYENNNVITIPADGTEYSGQIMLVKDDKADVANVIFFYITVTKKEEPAQPVAPEKLSASCDASGVTIKATSAEEDDFGMPTIYLEGKSDTTAFTLTLDIPEGWDNFVYLSYDEMMGGGIEPMALADDDEGAWAPVEAMTQQGFHLGNSIVIPADGQEHEYVLYLVKNNMVNQASMFSINSNVQKGSTDGVESIEATEDAEYFNLQGLKVANPAKGLYIRVINGKAVKVQL